MNLIILVVFIFFPLITVGQDITRPRGCFAGTNGTNASVLAHPDVRGVLLVEKWSDIESSPGEFDFTRLNQKINSVKGAGLKYALAVAAGAFGSPDWLIDSLQVGYHSFHYQGQSWRLPLWWESGCSRQLTQLIDELGKRYAGDSMLSHVYVSQMSVNGIEGHLNGVDMSAFAVDGYTPQKWIDAANTTTVSFADAFPDKPIVFEVHEIDRDTIVPATIINNLYHHESLSNRIGLGMWWLSGKTTYQAKLLDFIQNFNGDKYSQVIGRSDQTDRFEENDYSTVYLQAKQLGVRYMEPWPYEFQNHTNDSLMQDFNSWADANCLASGSCEPIIVTGNTDPSNSEVVVYPNPTRQILKVKIGYPYKKIEISVLNGNGQVMVVKSDQKEIATGNLPPGIYYIEIKTDDLVTVKKFTKF